MKKYKVGKLFYSIMFIPLSIFFLLLFQVESIIALFIFSICILATIIIIIGNLVDEYVITDEGVYNNNKISANRSLKFEDVHVIVLNDLIFLKIISFYSVKKNEIVIASWLKDYKELVRKVIEESKKRNNHVSIDIRVINLINK
ncbi:hypothetical protein [Vallitalea okinawensis]|uniref:hypothetical protein n=1 Tax=Vallitalea okinawensis TaxID=2078660 RepID=UPI000CFBB722|nr:hypothetical protein [Vallitalea okinawensis]